MEKKTTQTTATQVATVAQTTTQVATVSNEREKLLSFVVPTSKELLQSENKLTAIAQALNMSTAKTALEMYSICKAVYAVKVNELYKELSPVKFMGKTIVWTWALYAEEYLKMSRAKADQLARIGELFIDDNDNSCVTSPYEYSKLDDMLNGLAKVEKDDLKKRVEIIVNADKKGIINLSMSGKECREKTFDYAQTCKKLELSYDCEIELFESKKREYDTEQFNKRAQEIHDNGGLDNAEKEQKQNNEVQKAKEKATQAEKVAKAEVLKDTAKELPPVMLADLAKTLAELPAIRFELVITTNTGKAYTLTVEKEPTEKA